VSTLIPNTFHKICPGRNNFQFGQPTCGDGSDFSFFFSRPLKQLVNDRKVLIEFQGGGACWDANTCDMQKEYLSVAESYDGFVGMSCSEVEYGAATQGGYPLSMLCAKQIGETDFREYNYIVVPYCTQDVHIGDSFDVSYEDGSTIHHAGAHNMMSVLRWVFRNFPNPSHIFLTGCSAGGTAVPVAYSVLDRHYNTLLRGGRNVQINAIMDSSVYLTPSYFLQNYFPNWKPESLVKKKLHFNFDKYQYQENYPDVLWEHVLKRGSNRDNWGFVTHSSDPVSLMYYQYMSGKGGEDGDRRLVGDERSLENDNSESQWWTEINNSMQYVKARHKNVDFYVIDSEGHCSFGLYYPLQEEVFQTWASPIVKEGSFVGNRSVSTACFFFSLALGGFIVLLISRMRTKAGGEKELLSDDDEVGSTQAKRLSSGYILSTFRPLLSRFEKCPFTAAYVVASSIYFLAMVTSQGFAHPLDNPTFGPSAAGLSAFGINNSALVVYRMQHFRMLTSNLVYSGFTTFVAGMVTLYRTAVESYMMDNGHTFWHFPFVALSVAGCANLVYACLGNGASCSGLALILGLHAFSTAMQRHRGNSSSTFAAPIGLSALLFIVGCTPLFPFDSCLVLVASVLMGLCLGVFLYRSSGEESGAELSREAPEILNETRKTNSTDWRFVKGMGLLYVLLYTVILFRVPAPATSGLHPSLAGCRLVYADQIDDIARAYSGSNGGGERFLEDGEDWFDGQSLCAQLCLPHIVYRPALWGVNQFSNIPLHPGTCDEAGYQEYIASKTLKEFTMTFEVELFSVSNA